MLCSGSWRLAKSLDVSHVVSHFFLLLPLDSGIDPELYKKAWEFSFRSGTQ